MATVSRELKSLQDHKDRVIRPSVARYDTGERWGPGRQAEIDLPVPLRTKQAPRQLTIKMVSVFCTIQIERT